jgi:hypothetical protein
MWLIWTPNSRASFMPITFGQPCKVELCDLVMAFGLDSLPGGPEAYNFRVVRYDGTALVIFGSAFCLLSLDIPRDLFVLSTRYTVLQPWPVTRSYLDTVEQMRSC